MPKQRPDNVDFGQDFAQMAILLRGYGANGASLSRAIGCANETAMKKLAEPSRLTLGDLDKASKYFTIPMDKIRAAVVK